MVITQKYNSIFDVDKEFIPSIEDLLCDCIPSIESLQNFEKNSPENIHFIYYLFFSNHTNAPVGFAQIEITDITKDKKNFITKLFSKKTQTSKSSANWKIPGTYNEGVIFKPQYSRHINSKAFQIFQDLLKRDDITEQKICLSQSYTKDIDDFVKKYSLKQSSTEVIDVLLKNKPNYQVFFESLSSELQNSTKQNWRMVQKEFQYNMGEYDSFKKAFEYKSNARTQLKSLKENPVIKEVINTEKEVQFLTFETNSEIKSLIIYINGQQGHAFYIPITIDSEMTIKALHQQAIMKFFENDSSERLHCIGIENDFDYLKSLGFLTRNQEIFTATKSTDK